MNGRMEAEQMAAEHEARQPVAWATFFPNGSTHSVFVDGHRTPAGAEPLYRSPTLTDAEREAVEKAIGWIESPCVEDEAMPDDYLPITAALRGLLERTK